MSRIIIIEDELDLATCIEDWLRIRLKINCEIKIVSRVYSALCELVKNKYDLVISDGDLPDGKAEDIFHFLICQNRHKSTSFVMFSGSTRTSLDFKVVRKPEWDSLKSTIEQFNLK